MKNNDSGNIYQIIIILLIFWITMGGGGWGGDAVLCDRCCRRSGLFWYKDLFNAQNIGDFMFRVVFSKR
jgi:hypothetical protein